MPLVGFGFASSALDFLETVPHKFRRQIIKKARALHTNPFPPGVKKLRGVETHLGEPIYRERSGDYRILYIVREDPSEVIVLDIGNRKDIYKMPKTNAPADTEMRMKEEEFDDIMRRALGAAAAPKPGGETSPEVQRSSEGQNPPEPRRNATPRRRSRQ
ncbi:type II toxin-antitoxin system RelE family toxin [Roseomonas sp. FDAARGOS_362]|uniref:type II toxin-antitoxin system RelE family toxin n=1 Tax=Roseomonas sp. FDAARGOS_362 TaxID=2018065 RepID=UPI001D017C12